MSHNDISEFERSPRLNRTLVVIQPNDAIRLCTYGSENLTSWNGDIICDNENVSRSCSWFVSKHDLDSITEEFKNLVADDKYVFEQYKDKQSLKEATDLIMKEISKEAGLEYNF